MCGESWHFWQTAPGRIDRPHSIQTSVEIHLQNDIPHPLHKHYLDAELVNHYNTGEMGHPAGLRAGTRYAFSRKHREKV